LIQNTEKQNLPICVWYDFFDGLSKGAFRFTPGMDKTVQKGQLLHLATQIFPLRYQEVFVSNTFVN